MIILGIETSCDDTAVALYDSDRGVIDEATHNQIDIHESYGGVVPELASREHQAILPILVRKILQRQHITLKDISIIAATKGPGLIGALLSGYTFGQALSCFNRIPFIGVHHLEAHLTTCMLERKKPSYPFLCLLVSGGHTQLIFAQEFGRYTIVGTTKDDACGEAFDKGALLLGVKPGTGAALAALADSVGRGGHFRFKTPYLVKGKHHHRADYNFSFSGLKTQLRLLIQNNDDFNDCDRAKIAFSYQDSIVESLVTTTVRALATYRTPHLVLAGGVSANHYLRRRITERLQTIGVQVFLSSPARCTDNAAMVAQVGYLRRGAACLDAEQFSHPQSRWSIDELSPVR